MVSTHFCINWLQKRSQRRLNWNKIYYHDNTHTRYWEREVLSQDPNEQVNSLHYFTESFLHKVTNELHTDKCNAFYSASTFQPSHAILKANLTFLEILSPLAFMTLRLLPSALCLKDGNCWNLIIRFLFPIKSFSLDDTLCFHSFI